MYKNITPDYYGYRDDDDGVLAPKEAEIEVNAATFIFSHRVFSHSMTLYLLYRNG